MFPVACTTDLSQFLHTAVIGPVSRKRPFPTGLFFDWNLLVGLLVIVNRVDFIVFVLFLEAVDVREYFCMAVESRLAALCFVRAPRATLASRATNPRLSGLVTLDLAESRQSYVRDVALSREPPKLQQASPLLAKLRRYCRRIIHAAGEQSKECATVTCGDKPQQ